ncbi:MAG: hypothetical protein LH473_00430 [Chitinophagales bacterium]|nr:hypothetical protein [Chitinophagales bacterium]
MGDYSNSSQVSFMRFNTDGSIDSSFAIDGKKFFDNGHLNGEPTIASLEGNKVLCAYYYYGNLDTNIYLNFSRLLSDGNIDSSFGGSGTITYLVHFFYRDFFLQKDHKILAYGARFSPDFAEFFESMKMVLLIQLMEMEDT